MWYSITEKASLCFCQIVYQEILSMRKNMGSDLEDLGDQGWCSRHRGKYRHTPISIRRNSTSYKSDAMLRDITESEFITHAWPETDAWLSEDLQLYYSLRDELTYHAGCVVKSNRVVAPEALRETILQRMDGAYLVMSKTKALAQESGYWPKMQRSIESSVLRCKVYQKVGPRCNLIEPLQPHPIPRHTWFNLGSDIFYLKREIYLLLIDYYSNFPLIRNMVTSSTKEVCVVPDSCL